MALIAALEALRHPKPEFFSSALEAVAFQNSNAGVFPQPLQPPDYRHPILRLGQGCVPRPT
jgi:hypothetical protein